MHAAKGRKVADMAQPRITHLTKIPFGSNEPLLHRALEAGGVGLWDYTPSNGMIDLYHNVFSFESLRPGRYYGPLSEFTSYVAAEDLPAVERLLRQCEVGEPEVYVEFRVRRSNGDGDGVVWLACKGRNAPQANGKSRYVGAITDITEASERELKLLAYHESLFSLARNPLVVDRGDFARCAERRSRRAVALQRKRPATGVPASA